MADIDESVLQEWRERLASARRDRTTLRLRGSGTKDFYAEGLEGEVLDLRGWRGVVDYEPSELVISARWRGVRAIPAAPIRRCPP